MKKRHLILLIGCFSLFLFLSLAQDSSQGSSFSNKRAGVRAFFLALRELGHQVTPWLEPFEALDTSERGATMFVVSVPEFAGRKELENWVRLGNRLVLIASRGAEKAIGKDKKVENSKQGVGFLDLLRMLESDEENTPLNCDPSEIPECSGVSYVSSSVASIGTKRSGAKVLLGTATEPQISYRKHGRGDIFTFASNDVIVNNSVDFRDNFRFLYQIATKGERIYFDEFHHGFTKPVAAELKAQRDSVWLLVAALLIVLLVMALSRAVRFGPPTKVPDVTPSSTVEFAGVLGMLYSEHGASEVLKYYVLGWRKRLSGEFGINFRLSHSKALEKLAHQNTISNLDAQRAVAYLLELEGTALGKEDAELRVKYLEEILKTGTPKMQNSVSL